MRNFKFDSLDIFTTDSFGHIYKILIKNEITDFLEQANDLCTLIALINLIERNFFPHMKRIWERIIMVEMNLAAQDNLISGDTEEDRFEYFIKHFADDTNLRVLYKKYSILKPIWSQTIQTTMQSINLLINKLTDDIELILKTFHFSCGREWKVVDFDPVGDPHRGVQRTTRITVQASQDNEAYHFYYKPRNLEIDKSYYNFIQWWNKKSSIKHKAPELINCGDYGWANAAQAETCYSKEELENFYVKYGSIIAFSYVFASTDLHMENIIAVNEFPVLIDIETLFNCIFQEKKHYPIHYHLYASLLLPTHGFMGEIELSPLSAQGERTTEIEIIKKPEIKNTRIRMVAAKLETSIHKNQATLNNEIVDFHLYQENIINGFKETLSFIEKDKASFLSVVTQFFDGAKIRLIVRATEDYFRILYNQYHPNNLYQNKDDVARHKLAMNFFDSKILYSEIHQLNNGDIPLFETTIDSHSIIDGQNNKIKHVIAESALELITNQVSKLTSKHIEQLVEDIRYSFVAYRIRNNKFTYTDKYEIQTTNFNTKQSPSDFLSKCLTQGIKFILDSSLFEGQYVYWRKIFATTDNSVSTDITDTSFYEGASGILLLLYYYEKQAVKPMQCSEWIMLLRGQIVKELKRYQFAKLGAYSGTLGEVYALLYTSDATPHELILLYPLFENLLQKIAYTLITTEYKNYQQLDVISGVAGTLLRLLEIHHIYRTYPIANNLEKLMQIAFHTLIQHGETLVRKATTVGFSHGTAGVSAALCAYMRYFNIDNSDAITLIKFNIQRENQLKDVNGWQDTRTDNNEMPKTWCHGTIGMAISRLYLQPFITKAQFDSDINLACHYLRTEQTSLAPCHGMAGGVLFLNAFSYTQGENAAKQNNKLRNKLLIDITNIIKKEGFRLDFGLCNGEMLGLMTGLSGILYSLFDLKAAPNILCPALYLLPLKN